MLANPYIAFLVLLLGFGVLIFVHELGHFLVAKWVGIRCQQFAVGFGPALLAWRKGVGFRPSTTEPAYQQRVREKLQQQGKDPDQLSERDVNAAADEAGLGECEYRLNYIPLGGYVKMLGQEDLDPAARSDDPRSYNQKPIWARACVLSAGVVMNVIFGLLFFVVAFMIGVEFPTTQVGSVQPGSPAAEARAEGHKDSPAYRGLQVGDRVTHIDGERVRDMMEMQLGIALAPENASVRLTVERDGQSLDYVMTPRLQGELPTVGIQPMHSLNVGLVRDPALEEAGLTDFREAHLTQVAGESVENYTQLYRRLVDAAGEPVPVTFTVTDQAGETRQVQTSLAAEPQLTRAAWGTDDSAAANLLGLMPPVEVIGLPEGGGPATEAGVKTGDLIAELAGDPWPAVSQLPRLVENAEGAISLTVWRDGQLERLGPVEPENGRIGVMMRPFREQAMVGSVLPGSPTKALALPGGSWILAMNGQELDNWAQMQRRLTSLAKEEAEAVELEYRLNAAGQPVETRTVTLTEQARKQLVAAGWNTPRGVVFMPKREPLIAGGPVEAIVLGVEKTQQFIVNTYLTLVRLVQGAISPEAVRGPVGIVDAGTQAAQRGWSWLLFFLGLISVNLAVINFLPIPMLDGGHVVFLIIEKIKGSPPSAAVQNAATLAGLALIGCVVLLVTYNDIARIVGAG